jgi:hypothetical protein
MVLTKRHMVVCALLVAVCTGGLFGSRVARADEAAVQKLIEHLRDEDPFVRLKAAKALGRMGAAARSAIPALKALADDPDEDVRMVAANAIRKIGAGPDPRVAGLVENLGSGDAMVRMQAAKALGQLGPAAREALPALRKLKNDPDEDVRMIAASAIRKIAGDGAAPAEPPPAAPEPAPAAPPAMTPGAVAITSVTSLFCQGYKDVTGLISTPSSRFFLISLKNTSKQPVIATLLELAIRVPGEAARTEPVQGPAAVILPGRTVYHTFDLPIRKESTGFEIKVAEVVAANLDDQALATARRYADLLNRMRVMKARVLTSFGVAVGERFTLHNPDSQPAPGVRLVLLGYTTGGQLTTMQFYHCEEVAPGFSEYVNNPTSKNEPRKGKFSFDGIADARRDVFPDTYRGVVIGVGVQKQEH